MIWPLKKASLDSMQDLYFIISIFLSSDWGDTPFLFEKAVGKSQ